MRLHHLIAPLVLFAVSSCSPPLSSGAAADAGAPGGTPVRAAAVERRTLPMVVSGPGRTDALEQQKVRAPFKGKLVALHVADGDVVKTGDVIAEVLSQESEAMLVGAQALRASAQTPAARSDADRALQLARGGLVLARLRAPETAVVISHAADEGSLVADGQDLVSLAASDSFTFRADIVQTELHRVRPGQAALVTLSSGTAPVQGTVHAILPAASASDLTVGVRIDLDLGGPLALGLFGQAQIAVGEASGAIAVPDAAVLRDDLLGTQKVAVVAGGTAHWEEVTTGVRSAGWTELRTPALEPGTQVIVQGHVGLPEGAPVEVVP